MKPSKKIFSIIIAVLLFFAVVMGSGGCKNKKLIRLEVYSQLANYSGKQVGMMAAALEDKFGVEVVIIKDDEGIYETRMESGFLGDIVAWGSNGSEYKNAIKNGLLFDWEEEDLLKNYGPYILEHMSQALQANREINEDNKIHGIGHDIAPSADDHINFFYTWDIRWDLYDQLDRPEINDLNDYYNLMVSMKEICPKDDVDKDTYAVSLWPDWDGNMVMYVKAFASAYYGYDEHGIGLYDPNTGRFYGALEQGGPYFESLKFFNRLYRAGLLDPNSMTQTYDNMIEKVTNGGTFFSIFNYSGSQAFNSDDNIANDRMMLPLVPNEANVITYGMNPFGGNRIWSIGSDTRYPELCMEIINWLCTPEGSMYNFNGLQGLIWDYDEDGNTYFTEFGRKCADDPTTLLNGKKWKSPWSGKTYELSASFNDGKLQINNTTWARDVVNPDSNGETYNDKSWKLERGEPRCDVEAAWREWAESTTEEEYMRKRENYTVCPAINYSESVRDDELELVWTKVSAKLKELTWKAMYAEHEGEFNYLVSKMIADCKDLGYDQCKEWSENEAAIKWRMQQELYPDKYGSPSG